MEKNKQKKFIILGGTLVIGMVVIASIFFFVNQSNPKNTLNKYISLLNDKKYAEMYDLLSKESKSLFDEQTFVDRNQNIYEGIDAKNIEVEKITEKDNYVSFTMKMKSIAGNISFKNSVKMKKEDSYKLVWTSNMIFPDLDDEKRISVNVEEGKRGAILDRNNKALAKQGNIYEVGLVLEKMNGKEATIDKVSQLLSVSTTKINDLLSAEWVKDDLFIPIKKLSIDDGNIDALSQIEGVQINTIESRIYPYGEKAAHLTGYIQSINEDELKANKGKGYTSQSEIGKAGAEYIYEDTLRAQDGVSINLLSADGLFEKSIAHKSSKDGKDVILTININIQEQMYDKIAKDIGSISAMDAQTGEVLALVSSPSYNPNDFILGMSDEQWKTLSSDAAHPMNARFSKAYAPGSTFKAISGAIGLQSNTIKNDTDLGKVKDWLWQKDSSWGDYFVPTTKQYEEPSNLTNALKYSDNIYFAKLATQIGSEAYTKGLDAFGFNQKLDFDFPLSKSTYGEKMKDGITLATTGFGQGQLQVNPLHLTAMYTAFLHEGKMLKPYLQYEDAKVSYQKDHVISKNNAAIMKDDLIVSGQYLFPVEGQVIGGKTGTAEVGNEQIGYSTAWREEGGSPLLINVMIENAKAMNGSVYVAPIVQNIFESIQ